MLRNKAWSRGVILLTLGMLAAGALSISPATAGKLLKKKKAMKLFYPRAEADAQFLSPAEGDAQFLSPAEGDAAYLSATGAIRLNASPHTWVRAGQANPEVPQGKPEFSGMSFGPSTDASSNVPIVIAPTLPTVLSGRPLELTGVNACYTTSSNVTLDEVQIWSQTLAAGTSSSTELLNDPDPASTNCLDYVLPTPQPISPEEEVFIQYVVDYDAAGGTFTAYRATFVLDFA